MSAKHMRNPALYRCACGGRANVYRVTQGVDVTYVVMCPDCHAKTWPHATSVAAKMHWNRGERIPVIYEL